MILDRTLTRRILYRTAGRPTLCPSTPPTVLTGHAAGDPLRPDVTGHAVQGSRS